ncbi:hypothetical protein RJ641_002250 [Dillenia turbinata]|uniref:Uncharacterized protein n=1 Tax=Dillenia turbinata TaxID=194707 RepID=A0AAN8ZC15_9MAGN
MTEDKKPKSTPQNLPSSTPSKPKPPEISGEVGGNGNTKFHYPNPPDAVNPDAATLREQWKYATRQYSKWYSHAWGTAILAGLAFFALGWGRWPLLQTYFPPLASRNYFAIQSLYPEITKKKKMVILHNAHSWQDYTL